ncbi:MAG: sigma-70 family RNA polymerase sigma factor [Planctomycetes bacterium]|nr:sigma-70 family RNA polymerase sigma factor [Planctomycetota bacterium]
MTPTPRPDPLHELLADAGWVRSLAARLVADPGTAEDLAQETLVAAWSRPPAPGTPARPWLARVLRNFARQRSRSESARSQRERASATRSRPQDDPVERAELAQRLARAVLELAEPYRTTVLRRYFDGWSTEEIARAEGTNPSTVRTRLERGLAQLRARLEREGGAEWMSALWPLVPLKPGAAALASITGGILVGTGTKLALAVCAAALCGWILWPSHAPSAPPLELPVPTSAAAGAKLEVTPDALARSAVSEAPAKKPVESAATPAVRPPPAPGTIEGFVLRRSKAEDRPIAGALVTLHPGYDPNEPLAALELPELAKCRTAEDGFFRFPHVAPGEYTVRARSKDSVREVPAEVSEKARGPRLSLVFGSARIHGRIYDLGGAPFGEVVLRLDTAVDQSLPGEWQPSPLRSVRTSDAGGSYSFDDLPAGGYWLLVNAPGKDWTQAWPGRMCKLNLDEDQNLVCNAGSPQGAAHWIGSVRTKAGAVAQSAGSLWLDSPKLHVHTQVGFPATGEFDVPLDPGQWNVRLMLGGRGIEAVEPSGVSVSAQGLERDLVLSGVELSGTVLDQATRAALTGYAGVLQIRAKALRSRASPSTVSVDAQGRYVFYGLEPGQWALTTYPLKLAEQAGSALVTIDEGESTHTFDLEVRKR